MGAPQSVQGGLLGAAENYRYPMTQGLLAALTPDTQEALSLAGNPHAGPYSTSGNLVQPGPLLGGYGSGGSGGSSGASIATGLLGALAKNPSLIKGAYNGVSGLLGSDGLSAFGQQAASGTAAELGSAAAPALAADTAGALAPVIGAAPTAAELGTTASALAPIATSAAAPAAASAAAPAASAASGAGLGALAGGAAAVGGALLPLALAALIPTGENAQWWSGLTGQINSSNPDTATQGKLTLANDLLNHPSDDPYTQAQLQAWGIPQIMQDISRPITTPSPDGRGWLGGGFTGASRA